MIFFRLDRNAFQTDLQKLCNSFLFLNQVCFQAFHFSGCENVDPLTGFRKVCLSRYHGAHFWGCGTHNCMSITSYKRITSSAPTHLLQDRQRTQYQPPRT